MQPTPDAERSPWSSSPAWGWSAVTAVVATGVYGTVWWSAAYADLDFGAFTLGVFALAAVPAIALRASGVAPFLMAAGTLPAALITAVMVRVAVDVMADPTSHNLWPFEVVFAGVIGAFWGLVAAGVGELLLRLRR
jgi:hypothetical protein